MLKRFFISMLGTVAGVFISSILAVFVIIAVIGVAAGKSLGGETKLTKHSILHIKLDGSVEERFQAPSLMEIVQGASPATLTLEEVRDALALAAKDEKIDGLFLDCGALSAGSATIEEMVGYISKFKESGKWVYAYADGYTQGAYTVASAADSLFLNPIGAVDVHGVASVTPFFRDLLNKVGVSMQIIKVGTYKSAVEPFILNEMSAPARQQAQEYVDSIWKYTTSTIAAGRGVEAATVNAWADSICATWPAARCLSENMVSATAYRRVFENRLRALTERDADEDLHLVTPSEYLAAGSNPFSDFEEKDHVAVLYACGDIVDSGKGGIVGEKMVPEIISLADDDKVKGLVLRVNSGGGSAFASEQIWEALEYFKSKDKPFYVSMGDYAASGGYYISCGADRIFADATTLTGSIGVFGMIPDASELLNSKLGVHFSTVQSNSNAVFPVYFYPMTDIQRDAMQCNVDSTYALFTGRVAEGRDLSVDSVRTIAEGRVWVGTSALRLELVDEIGGISEAIAAATAECGLDKDRTVFYPKMEENMWATLLRESEALDAARAAAGYTPVERHAMRLAGELLRQNRIQARMPMTLIR